MNRNIPDSERILVLQGGGSLGAYEAGAYKGIFELVKGLDKKGLKNSTNVFDIIAGSSIGAINAAILVSYVKENGTFEGSAEKLMEFWQYLSEISFVERIPYFKQWWDYCSLFNKTVASGESARRYYSAKEFSVHGVPNVFSQVIPHYDTKFFDVQNTWFRYGLQPLKESLEKFAKFPIATSWDEFQPRLLLVAVDVATSYQVVFDSYERSKGLRYSEYGKHIKKENNNVQFEYTIRYDQGITSNHVIASAAFPINFDYVTLNVEKRNLNREYISSNSGLGDVNFNKEIFENQARKFWDGGLMNNTPLMNAIYKHRDFWYHTRGINENVPSLKIAIINLHPRFQNEIPTDRDGVINRNNDIMFSDKTITEEGYLLIISDYIDLVKQLINLLGKNNIKSDEVNSILDKNTRPHGLFSKLRTYRNLIEGRFNIEDIIRIERKNDEHTTSTKTYDFSNGTINGLLKEGYMDALSYIKEYYSIKKSNNR